MQQIFIISLFLMHDTMANKKKFLDSWNFHSCGEKTDNKLTNEYIKADLWIVKASAKKLRQVNMLGSD